MFTGRRFDIETGLYYYRARYYNPHIGRFMQTDPVGYDAGINWYLYCNNNPLGLVDPFGCDPCDACDLDVFDIDADPCDVLPDPCNVYYEYLGFKITYYSFSPYGSPSAMVTAKKTLRGIRWTFKVGKYVLKLSSVASAQLSIASAYLKVLEEVAVKLPQFMEKVGEGGPFTAWLDVNKYERTRGWARVWNWGRKYKKTRKYIPVIGGNDLSSAYGTHYGIYATQEDALDAIIEARDIFFIQ